MWDDVYSIIENSPQYPPGNSDIAVGPAGVFVVWDWCVSSGECSEYSVIYSRTGITGDLEFRDWDNREVGTDETGHWRTYYSSDDVSALPGEYLLGLRPSIALNKDGWPAVVWHADVSGGDLTDYVVYYSYAITVTDSGISWTLPIHFRRGQPYPLGAPSVGVEDVEDDDNPLLHIAYMQNLGSTFWDIYYTTSAWENYPHVYLPLVSRSG